MNQMLDGLSRFMVRLALLAVLLMFVAGCTSPKPAVVDSYDLIATGVPDAVVAGENFTFQLTISGPVGRMTDHIGGHFWSYDTADPTGEFSQQAGACFHVAGGGNLPGTYMITCALPGNGTYYMHGHARYTADSETINAWTSAWQIVAS